MDFSERSHEKELLDRDDIPSEDIFQNMRELDIINTRLGGHAINIDAVKTLCKTKNDQISIMEIGCGGGDNLRAIHRYFESVHCDASYIGVDINADCISYAEQKNRMPRATWMTCDYREARTEKKPDIIFSSLFCHHFDDDQLVEMMQWMSKHSTRGFFINDLHRHWLAYHSIRLITSVFSSSYLVKNDAPVSVRRGFTRNEWRRVLTRAGIKNFSIEWKWAFRWLIIAYPS
jgi:2-polyprenyl-3-methyl-5-hydroxy-6-metoxy-1,4-benzoquinol methylase